MKAKVRAASVKRSTRSKSDRTRRRASGPHAIEAAAEELSEFGPRKGHKGKVHVKVPKAGSSPCLCGCGVVAKRRFLAGHDAKLHGAVLRAKKAGERLPVSEAAAGWLLGKPWASGGYTTKA
jgi:hypothetical protein